MVDDLCEEKKNFKGKFFLYYNRVPHVNDYFLFCYSINTEVETWNDQLHGIVTPIKVEKYTDYLLALHFNTEQARFLIKGFQHGFDIGYRGPRKRQETSENIPIRGVGSLEDMWSKLLKEVKLGRHAGPLRQIPYQFFMQSPIGLVPKAGDQTRLIFHLSFDFGMERNRKSLNFHTPDELCTVKYNDLDYAIDLCLKLLGKPDCQNVTDESSSAARPLHLAESHIHQNNTELRRSPGFCADIVEHTLKTIFMSKSDLKSAFKILPIMPLQRQYLIMKYKCPKTRQTMFFVKKCLPFGSSVSCARFQLFSESLQCLVELAMDRYFFCTNYLDDYMFISTSEDDCNEMVRVFMKMCEEIGCPVSFDKTEWVTSCITFLGILINGETHSLSIPEDKRRKALNMIDWALGKKKVTIRFIQQLTGTLNFINRAIVPGHAFTKGMYDKLKIRDKNGNQLKQYHHIKLYRSFLDDCAVWKQFLMNASVVELCRPFVDLHQFADARELNFYSDASLNKNFGLGAVYSNSWIMGYWGAQFIQEQSPSIEFLELFALVAAILTWSDRSELANTRVIIYCDNQATQHMINNLASNCPHCLKLIRILTFNNLQFNRRVFVKYVRSQDNVLADALSRADFKRFWKHAPVTMTKFPDKIPEQLWPVSKVWFE